MSLFQKKTQAENLEDYRDITDDVIEGDFVPYACHWDPHTIVTKNGELLQTIKITGFVHEQLDHDDDTTDLRSQIREAIRTCVDDTHYAVWIHTIRRKKSLQAGGEFKRDFAGYLNRFWNDRNDWEHQFTNEVYVTIVHEGQGASIFDPAGFVRGIVPYFDIKYREKFLAAARERLNTVVERMLPVLDRFGAHRLGIVKKGDVYYSEPSAFLGKLITMLDFDFPVTDVDMSHYLTDYDVTFGFNAMEVRMRDATKQRRFGTILTMKEYRELPIDSLDRLLHVPAEFIISQCFTFISTKRALADYEYQKELFDLSKSDVLAERTGLANILAADTGKTIDYGEHQINIFLLADSLKSMDAGLVKAVNALASLGMIPMREDIKLEECYWAQLPANFEFVKRLRPINTSSLGGFANLSNFPAGKKDGNHWGTAVTTFYTAARTPYFFNFHDKNNGHTSIIGPYGAGKTVLMNFLLAQAQKFDGKVFFFDKDRSSEIFLRSLSGNYFNPWPGADARPYAGIGLNPFAMKDAPAVRSFISRWVLTLANATGDAQLLSVSEKTLAEVMKLPVEQRGLAAFIAALPPESGLAEKLAAWNTGGEFAAVFGTGPETFAFDTRICGFEMGAVMAHRQALVPVLSYLLWRISQQLDGSPSILVIDEAWMLLDHPYFAASLREWLDALRARNTMVIFATEYVEQARTSSINATLMAAVASQIYLPDEGADGSYTDAFNLTEKEISYLTVMNTDDRHFLLKREGHTIVAELNLSGMADIIAVLSATEQHLAAMEDAITSQGLTPAQWMPKFLERI